MALNTTSTSSILTPDDVGQLLVRPTLALSIAAQVSTVVNTGSHNYRIPVVSADPSAGWVAEGAEISPSDPTLTEVVVTPMKVAGLTIISRELAEDSSPAAAQVVGDGLARDIARKIDAAFFGNTTTNGPSGLLSLTTGTSVEAGADFETLDAFAGAIAAAEQVGAVINSFVTSPTEALAVGAEGEHGQHAPTARRRRDRRDVEVGVRIAVVRVLGDRGEDSVGDPARPRVPRGPVERQGRGRSVGVLHV